jgi:hypothetical protein
MTVATATILLMARMLLAVLAFCCLRRMECVYFFHPMYQEQIVAEIQSLDWWVEVVLVQHHIAGSSTHHHS